MEYQKVRLPFKVKKSMLALGSESKNTIAFAEGATVYLSSVHQDLSNLNDFLVFEQRVKYFLKKRPAVIAYDLHPQYHSSKYALGLASGKRHLTAVQHHHAHIASCMADNGLKNQKVLGVAFDGTGLGQDDTLWGAEFLICDYQGFKRMAHLRPIALLGAEAAIKQPWRLTLMWLFLTYGERLWDLDIGLIKTLERNKWRVLKRMYSSGFNSPFSSSMGRLFDSVGALVLNKKEAHFEAELAIGLERLAARCNARTTVYPFKIIKNKEGHILDPLPMFRAIIADLRHGEPGEKIAYGFHLTVAEMIKRTLLILARDNGLNKAVLSGGVFQNRLLCRMITDTLHHEDFQLFLHRDIPCNDAGISLGQIAAANYRN